MSFGQECGPLSGPKVTIVWNCRQLVDLFLWQPAYAPWAEPRIGRSVVRSADDDTAAIKTVEVEQGQSMPEYVSGGAAQLHEGIASHRRMTATALDH
jgi:hypothetical protein